MLAVEAWALTQALSEPQVVSARLRSRPIKKRCPVLRTIFTDDRRVPAVLDSWWDRVREGHPVYE
jgi:hypothetical protein